MSSPQGFSSQGITLAGVEVPIRTLRLLFLVLLFVTGNASAQPLCFQVVDADDWCAPIYGCSRALEWRGSCENNPPDREYRCRWDGQECEGGTQWSVWAACDCATSGGCDCLLAGTPITLADGTTKPVEAIQVGDRVLGFDESTRSMKPAKVVAVHAPFETDHYFIINGKIRMTEAHPVLSRGKWVLVGELKVGDALTDSKGHTQVILSMEEVDEIAPTYNFQVSGGTYVAGGIVVHNKENCEHFMLYPE